MKNIICLSVLTLLVVPVMAQPTARQWNNEVVAGWNLGNQLECPAPGADNESVAVTCPANHMQAETAWGNPTITARTIEAVKDAGFNAIRIPIRWQHHITDAATMTIDEAWLARVKEVVGYCLTNDMKVIINTHHDQWLERRPTYDCQEENNDRLAKLWTNIAHAFKDYDYQLAFAGTNEVHIPNNWNAPTTENQTVQNSYNQAFVTAVRATGGNNTKRHLIVQTYNCDLNFGLKKTGFIVPQDIEGNGKDYMSVEFHYYTPWEYCGEAVKYYWGSSYSSYSGVSSQNEQHMKNDLLKAAEAWGSQGLGIIIGEWGITDHYNSAVNMSSIHLNMTYYCKTLVSEARKQGIATFVWDNNAFGNGKEKYGIFDRKNNMDIKASWIINGIKGGTSTGISVANNKQHNSATWSKFFSRGRIVICKDGQSYNLAGQPLEH